MSGYNFQTIDGGMVRLCEKDLNRWKHVFSELSLDEELNKISLESAIRPWMRHKSWFFQLSGYLHKLEKGEIKPMAYEHREGQGSLFKNDKKTGNQPDYRGTAMVGGQVKRIAAWIKEGKNGKFFSLSIQDDLPRNEPLQDADKANGSASDAPPFDDIPW